MVDTVGNPPRARIHKFELFELILLLRLDTVPCRAIRGSSISANSTLPLLGLGLPLPVHRGGGVQRRREQAGADSGREHDRKGGQTT